MADNSGLITVAALAGAGFLAYKYLGAPSAATAAPAPSPAPTGSTPTTPQYPTVPTPLPPAAPIVTVPPAPPAVASPSLSTLHDQFFAAAESAQQAQMQAGGDRFGPDQFNYILAQVYPPAAPLPAPEDLFSASGWVRPAAIPIAAYWAAIAPWLTANKGLSGYKPNQSVPPSTQLMPMSTNGFNQAWRRIHGQYGVGDLVPCPPGNVCDLSLVGSRAAFQAPHTVLAESGDWDYPQSIGQEAGRFSMAGPLPGRYYGAEWLAPNSGDGTSVATSLFGGLGDQAPAADLPQAQSGAPIGPVTFITPMPSVLQPRRNEITAQDVQPCPFSQWVSDNPLPAVAGALAIFFLLRGDK